MALKEEDQIKERIRYQTELVKLFVVTFIATTSGVLALLSDRVDNGAEVVFTAGGLIIAIICVGMIYVKHRIIRDLINGK